MCSSDLLNLFPSHDKGCPNCSSLMFFKEVENQDNVCPKCEFHMRIGAKRRVEILADENSFVEFDTVHQASWY